MGNCTGKALKTKNLSNQNKNLCSCEEPLRLQERNNWFTVPYNCKRIIIYANRKGSISFKTPHRNSENYLYIYKDLNLICLCGFPIDCSGTFYCKIAGVYGSNLTKVNTSRKDTLFFINYSKLWPDILGDKYHCLSLQQLAIISLYQYELEGAFNAIGTQLPYCFKDSELILFKQFPFLKFCFEKITYTNGCIYRDHCISYNPITEKDQIAPLW
jgi:hypothetical protein